MCTHLGLSNGVGLLIALAKKERQNYDLDNVDPVLQLHTIISKVIKDVNSILGTQHPFIYPCRVFMDKKANRI